MRSCCWHSHICLSQLGSHVDDAQPRLVLVRSLWVQEETNVFFFYCRRSHSTHTHIHTVCIRRLDSSLLAWRKRRRRRCDHFSPFDAAGQVSVFAWTTLDSSTELLTLLGGSKWEPTARQVMCTGWITFIYIMREVTHNIHLLTLTAWFTHSEATDISKAYTNSSDLCLLAVGVFHSYYRVNKKAVRRNNKVKEQVFPRGVMGGQLGCVPLFCCFVLCVLLQLHQWKGWSRLTLDLILHQCPLLCCIYTPWLMSGAVTAVLDLQEERIHVRVFPHRETTSAALMHHWKELWRVRNDTNLFVVSVSMIGCSGKVFQG